MIVTRGIRTVTGSPSLPFSVRVTSSLRQLTTLADVRKADQLELADDLLDRHLGVLSPGAHNLRARCGPEQQTFLHGRLISLP